ncbi:MAG TPA: DUF2797 domain-containing protein [Flavobacteriales bacterium]|nr:DUF2797 domain-containing protein [Flavobacteriales bacterium]
MMNSGNLLKMRVEKNDPVDYFLVLGDSEIHLNPYIGRRISLSFNGQINCIACGRLTSKSFAGGFCYPCMVDSPFNAECIIRPELCEAHLGKGRDPEWEKKNHIQPHTVYIALSSGLKVGVTRDSQIPDRWIDQGATKAIRLAGVPNRYLAGKIEVFLKDFMSDKTAWQKMLKNEVDFESDLIAAKYKASSLLPAELKEFYSENDEITELTYPVLEYPKKLKSTSFDKQAIFEGTLKGIKGQYLMLSDDRVLNIRRHSGYYVIFKE